MVDRIKSEAVAKGNANASGYTGRARVPTSQRQPLSRAPKGDDDDDDDRQYEGEGIVADDVEY